MSIGSIFQKLIKPSGTTAKTEQVEYKGFMIEARPFSEGSQYVTAGVIQKSGKTHEFIRADRHSTKSDATAHSLQKARQIIDEQGARLFD